MAAYKYSAISRDGEKVSGLIDAFDEMDAAAKIKETCTIVLKISPVEEKKEGILNMEIGGKKLNSKAFTIMCSQFAIILRSGIEISRATWLIAEKTKDKVLKKLLKEVAEDVEAGRSIAASFANRGKKLLPVTFIETIRAGEESGNLYLAFESMYNHYDKQMKIKGKVKNALTYPIFVVVIAIVVVIVLMVKVVPTFIDIFASQGSELPAITQSLVVLSNFFAQYIWLILVIVVAAVIVYKLMGVSEDGKIRQAKAALKMPVLGNIRILSAASEFANNMTILIASGLPITRAISITARVMSNYFIGKQIGKMTKELEEGRSLGDAMRKADCLPDILVDMTAVGEETGELEETLGTISKFYDSELDMATKDALAKLEPAVLVIIAGFAGYIVLAVYIAMFSMYAGM